MLVFFLVLVWGWKRSCSNFLASTATIFGPELQTDSFGRPGDVRFVLAGRRATSNSFDGPAALITRWA